MGSRPTAAAVTVCWVLMCLLAGETAAIGAPPGARGTIGKYWAGDYRDRLLCNGVKLEDSFFFTIVSLLADKSSLF